MTKKKLGLIIGIAAACVLAVYFGFALYFNSHFYFGSTVNGVNSSGKTVSEVEEALSKKTKDYSLTLKEADDKEEEISSDEAGLTISFKGGEVDELLSNQSPFKWISGLLNKKAYESKNIAEIDEKVLDNTLKNLDCVKNSATGTQTEDATFSYSDGEFKIQDEIYGTNIDEDAFKENVLDALTNFKSSLDLTKSKSYVQPKITKDDEKLNDTVSEMNKKLAMKISYTGVNETVPSDVIAGFLSLDDDDNITVNSEKVAEYVDTLVKKYTTSGHPKTLHTSYGKDVTISNGDYGWKIDKDAEIAELTSDVEKGEDVSREIMWKKTAASHEGNDYGNSYVEVNLTAQHLFLYVNGAKVLETDVVTGNPSKGNATPTGAYGITYCEKDATLKGENYTSHVKYWMPFNGNVGMHDASWRSQFGSDLYLTHGSHGCVNLPPSVAPKIFAQVKTNFPVLVYTLPGTGKTINFDAANAVIAKIDALGAVTLESEAAIADARASYEALDSATKTVVTNIDTLTNAEAALNTLKAQAGAVTPDPAAQTTDGTTPITNDAEVLGTETPAAQ